MKLSLLAMFALAHATSHNDLQEQCGIKDLEKKAVCEELRDKAYEKSQKLEHSFYAKSIIRNIQNTLNKFENHDCYDNQFLPAIDRDLIKKLDEDLKK